MKNYMIEKFKNNPKLISLLEAIDTELEFILRDQQQLNIMEICGTHTVSILKHGFRNYFQSRINFLSGPGCPVCVTSQKDIDKVIELAKKRIQLVTFGDLIKVPGTETNLEKQISQGAKVDVVYNPLECLKIARQTNDEVVFIAVGFETTIPVIASLILDAEKQGIHNLSILSLVKTMPNVLKFILADLDLNLDGFICPGHVSVIIGEEPYRIMPDEYGIPCTIAGFEPVDVGLGIESLISQIKYGRPFVDNRYKRMVTKEGNHAARRLIDSVFTESDVVWRGFGTVPASGLKLRNKYEKFDTEKKFEIDVKYSQKTKGCICGEIISGNKSPGDCNLFRKDCTPDTPVGPCMVSFEGACSAYYKYGK